MRHSLLLLLEFILLFHESSSQLRLATNFQNTDGDSGFGYDIAVDNVTAVVSEYSVSLNISRVVYVYTRENSQSLLWTMQAMLTAPDTTPQDRYGYAVAISGNIVVIGAPSNSEKGVESGAVYLYQWANGTWTMINKLTASDAEPYNNFGTSVAISGNTVIVGAPGEGPTPTGGSPSLLSTGGTAYVFVGTSGVWTQRGRLRTPATLSMTTFGPDNFGETVALSPDGTAAIVGAPATNGGIGAVYIFGSLGTIWGSADQLVGISGDMNFGGRLAVSTATLLVTATDVILPPTQSHAFSDNVQKMRDPVKSSFSTKPGNKEKIPLVQEPLEVDPSELESQWDVPPPYPPPPMDAPLPPSLSPIGGNESSF